MSLIQQLSKYQPSYIQTYIIFISIIRDMNKPVNNDDYEQGQLPDDSEQQPPQQKQPESQRKQPVQRERSLSSQEIIFETVTDTVIHSEKKKKKIHKDKKQKQPGQSNKEREGSSHRDKANQNNKSKNDKDNEYPPSMFPPYPPDSNMYPRVPPPPYYPSYMMPPLNQPPNMPVGSIYPYGNQPYLPPNMLPNYSYGGVPPPMVPQQYLRGPQPDTRRGYPGANYPNMPMPPGAAVNQEGKIDKSKHAHNSDKLPSSHDKGSNIQKAGNNIGKNKQSKNESLEDQKNKSLGDRSGEKHFGDGSKLTHNDKNDKHRGREEDKKKVAKEDMKSKIRKHIKIFSAQQQLEILQITKCLIKYAGQHTPSQTLQCDLKQSYNRSLDYIETLSKESQEKEDSIRKILEAFGIGWVWMEIKERKLYFRAMKDRNFAKIGEQTFPKNTNAALLI